MIRMLSSSLFKRRRREPRFIGPTVRSRTNRHPGAGRDPSKPDVWTYPGLGVDDVLRGTACSVPSGVVLGFMPRIHRAASRTELTPRNKPEDDNRNQAAAADFTASTISPTMLDTIFSSSPSAITRMTGSVPEGRMTSRPFSPSFAFAPSIALTTRVSSSG